MADRNSRPGGEQGGRWHNEYERSFTAEQHHDDDRPRRQGNWQYGSQGSLRDNPNWQNQSRGWQGGAQAGRHGEGYGSQRGDDEQRVQYGRGYGSQASEGYGSWRPPEEGYSGYTGSNYGYGRSGSPGTYQGGGYARDPYYNAPRHEIHEHHHGHWGHDNPEWEREMQSAKRARWGGEGYGGPIEGPHFDEAKVTREARRPGSHRWPKSYQRSDERIREDIYERLLQDHYVDCSNITVVVASGVVTLEGTVPERHMKHQVENIADDCSGVKDIDNKLRISQVDTRHADASTVKKP